jgi:hypothetical protein
MKFEWIEIDGYMLRAPKHFLSSEYVETGRCGPSNGSVLEQIIPERILWLKITAACKIHDYCYAVAKNTRDKDTADIEMFANCFRIMKQRGQRYNSMLHKCLCFPRAVIMTWYMLAVLFGGQID